VNISRRQFIAFSCILLFQLGLFASLAHAAEHPFHAHGDLCASFINFGHQDMSADVASPAIEFNLFSVEVCAENNPLVVSSFRPAYSSRAPPAS
jgi:hypothetical protein